MKKVVVMMILVSWVGVSWGFNIKNAFNDLEDDAKKIEGDAKNVEKEAEREAEDKVGDAAQKTGDGVKDAANEVAEKDVEAVDAIESDEAKEKYDAAEDMVGNLTGVDTKAVVDSGDKLIAPDDKHKDL